MSSLKCFVEIPKYSSSVLQYRFWTLNGVVKLCKHQINYNGPEWYQCVSCSLEQQHYTRLSPRDLFVIIWYSNAYWDHIHGLKNIFLLQKKKRAVDNYLRSIKSRSQWLSRQSGVNFLWRFIETPSRIHNHLFKSHSSDWTWRLAKYLIGNRNCLKHNAPFDRSIFSSSSFVIGYMLVLLQQQILILNPQEGSSHTLFLFYEMAISHSVICQYHL